MSGRGAGQQTTRFLQNAFEFAELELLGHPIVLAVTADGSFDTSRADQYERD